MSQQSQDNEPDVGRYVHNDSGEQERSGEPFEQSERYQSLVGRSLKGNKQQ